ncbi:hypothetical protein J6590_044794 [Homalodisca vitripennis]|nr:hypothetical protein J6590_044794 [Homalodisca vitripennis]
MWDTIPQFEIVELLSQDCEEKGLPFQRFDSKQLAILPSGTEPRPTGCAGAAKRTQRSTFNLALNLTRLISCSLDVFAVSAERSVASCSLQTADRVECGSSHSTVARRGLPRCWPSAAAYPPIVTTGPGRLFVSSALRNSRSVDLPTVGLSSGHEWEISKAK